MKTNWISKLLSLFKKPITTQNTVVHDSLNSNSDLHQARMWSVGTMEFFQAKNYEEALLMCDELIVRFGASQSPDVQEVLAGTLYNKGAIYLALEQWQNAADCQSEIIQRFSASTDPQLQEYCKFATAYLNQAPKES